MYKQTGVKPGSPPHTRGKVRHLSHIPQLVGITPAHAGKSPWTAPKRQRNGDHPRTRGEKQFFCCSMPLWWGSPPHTRGKVTIRIPTDTETRITPAHAGKSTSTTTSPGNWLGSPPHTRGKEKLRVAVKLRKGITPAHAGKSFVFGLLDACHRDHPRTRGEKSMGLPLGAGMPGSPPHTRGKD